jgi:hypothetical protein
MHNNLNSSTWKFTRISFLLIVTELIQQSPSPFAPNINQSVFQLHNERLKHQSTTVTWFNYRISKSTNQLSVWPTKWHINQRKWLGSISSRINQSITQRDFIRTSQTGNCVELGVKVVDCRLGAIRLETMKSHRLDMHVGSNSQDCKVSKIPKVARAKSSWKNKLHLVHVQKLHVNDFCKLTTNKMHSTTVLFLHEYN